jgi:hypothetical protein
MRKGIITLKKKSYKCESCANVYKSEMDLNKHSEEVHMPKRNIMSFRQKFSQEERKRNVFCRFWDHAECHFGDECKFLHEEAPHCRFKEQCRAKPRCQSFHVEYASSGNLSSSGNSSPSSSFLGYRPFQARWNGKNQNQRSY